MEFLTASWHLESRFFDILLKLLQQISINLSSHILAVYLSSLRCQPLIWLWAPKSKPDSMERMDLAKRSQLVVFCWNAVAGVNLSLLDFDVKNRFPYHAHLKYLSTKLVKWASYFPQSTHLFCKAPPFTDFHSLLNHKLCIWKILSHVEEKFICF